MKLRFLAERPVPTSPDLNLRPAASHRRSEQETRPPSIERRKLTSNPPNKPSHQHTAVMSAAWKSAGLTYVSPNPLAPPMRCAQRRTPGEDLELMLYAATTAT